jgi:hypothetical protein
MSKTLTGTFYLALSPKKVSAYRDAELSARISTKPPSLNRGEVAMKLVVNVPASLFEAPALRASVTIPEGTVTPHPVDAAVLDNVQELLSARLGLDVQVAMVEERG